MIDPELLEGRNRPQWVEEHTGRPHVAFAPDPVVAPTVPWSGTPPPRDARHRRRPGGAGGAGPAPATVGGDGFDGVARRHRRGGDGRRILLTGGTSRRLGTDKAALHDRRHDLAVVCAATLRGARAATRWRSVRATPTSPRSARTRRARARSPHSSPGADALVSRTGAPPDRSSSSAVTSRTREPALDALLAAPAAASWCPVDGTVGRSTSARGTAPRCVARAVARGRGERSLRALADTVAPPRAGRAHDLPAGRARRHRHRGRRPAVGAETPR